MKVVGNFSIPVSSGTGRFEQALERIGEQSLRVKEHR
jgi:hypothetical protein